ncbi:DUF4157 domain-containing protein [Glycomyces sp. NPDC048151]|uniref:eCIS core domain-containing protein n=1 Tax=Glycomyces sp. NPDC048151 TaxID=3364002 RepID=UPI0037131A45
MRDHGNEFESDSLRPKADRIEQSEFEPALPAAALGRADVLGAEGVLGLQRAVGNAGVATMLEEERSPVHDVIGSGGSPLDLDTRADMEGRFGQDFSNVRVHTDSAAHESAKSVNAQAYTVGSDIVFQSGNYDPGSDSGKHMLAHELTHVVQQRSGPVDGTDAGGGVKVSDPSDRFEREASANADAVMSAPAPAAPVQRCDDGCGDTEVQRLAEPTVQREEAPEPAEEDPEAMAQTYVQRTEEEEEPAADA